MFRTSRATLFPFAALVALNCARTFASSPDLSTPKKAALEFAKGLEAGDVDAIKASSVGSSDDYKIAEVISGLIRSARELRSAAIAKFGEPGRQVLPIDQDLADFSKAVGTGIEKIVGDTATVAQPGEADPIKLKKSDDGTWRVNLSAMDGKEEIRDAMPKLQKVLTRGTADIKAGKYLTLDQAKDAISRQTFAAIAEPLTTQPAAGEKK